MSQWKSPLKLFLDIETEEDVERNRTAATSPSPPGWTSVTTSASVTAQRSEPELRVSTARISESSTPEEKLSPVVSDYSTVDWGMSMLSGTDCSERRHHSTEEASASYVERRHLPARETSGVFTPGSKYTTGMMTTSVSVMVSTTSVGRQDLTQPFVQRDWLSQESSPQYLCSPRADFTARPLYTCSSEFHTSHVPRSRQAGDNTRGAVPIRGRGISSRPASETFRSRPTLPRVSELVDNPLMSRAPVSSGTYWSLERTTRATPVYCIADARTPVNRVPLPTCRMSTTESTHLVGMDRSVFGHTSGEVASQPEYQKKFGTSWIPMNQSTVSSREDICCNFCKRNGETKRFYSNHRLMDRRGIIQCPVLRSYKCPICGATGDTAHTVSYCPFSRGESTVAAARTPRKSCGCKRNCRHGSIKRHLSSDMAPRL